VNTYEIAILRILVKQHHPIKISTLVDGFPDHSDDNVLQAVSNLHFLGYVSVSEFHSSKYICLCKDMTKEVLKIVNPNLDKVYQAAQNFHSSFIINPPAIKKADKTKTNENGPRQLVLTGAIVLAAMVIVSVIATGAPLLQYLPVVNDQKLTNIIRPNLISTSTSVQKYQPVNDLIHTSLPRQGNLYFITITTTKGSNGQSFIDSVFIVEDSIKNNNSYDHNYNAVHKTMTAAESDKHL
jgi:hypothetical protein